MHGGGVRIGGVERARSVDEAQCSELLAQLGLHVAV